MHCVYSVKYTLYCHMCTLCFPCQFLSSWKFLSKPFYVGDQHKIGVKFLAWVHILCQLSRFWFRNSHHLPGIQCDRLCLENHPNFDPTHFSNVALSSDQLWGSCSLPSRFSPFCGHEIISVQHSAHRAEWESGSVGVLGRIWFGWRHTGKKNCWFNLAHSYYKHGICLSLTLNENWSGVLRCCGLWPAATLVKLQTCIIQILPDVTWTENIEADSWNQFHNTYAQL